MPKTILMEEFHVTLIAPADLRKTEYQAILRTLRGKRFQARLLDAIQNVFHLHPSLKKVRIDLNR